MQQARDRLADAEAILGTAHPAVVVSAAYYGCPTPPEPPYSSEATADFIAAIERLLKS